MQLMLRRVLDYCLGLSVDKTAFLETIKRLKGVLY